MRASRVAESRSWSQWRLARTADGDRYRDVKLYSTLLGWSNPDQALRVAAGIPGKRASGGRTRALRARCQGCEAFLTMHRTWKPQSGVELNWRTWSKQSERLQASLQQTSQMSAERLEPKGKRSRSGMFNVVPARTHRTAGVQSGPKSFGTDAEHGKAASLGHDWFVVGPTARQGEQEQHWDDRRSQGRDIMFRICHVGLAWKGEKVCGTTSTWELQ